MWGTMCFQVVKELNFVFIMVYAPFVVFYYTSWNNNFKLHVSCNHGHCPCLLFQVSKRDLPMVLSSKNFELQGNVDVVKYLDKCTFNLNM